MVHQAWEHPHGVPDLAQRQGEDGDKGISVPNYGNWWLTSSFDQV